MEDLSPLAPAACQCGANSRPPFLNENFAFYGKTLQGQEELKPRWKRCTEYVDDYLGRGSRPGLR